MKNSIYTIRLLVDVSDGTVTMADGTPLPLLKAGAHGELLVDPQDILDEATRQRLLTEKRVELFPAATALWARVGIDYPVPAELREFRVFKHAMDGKGVFVGLSLSDALNLEFNEGTEGKLARCNCKVPALPESEFNSLNKAYTGIAKVFESTRSGWGGNVFNKIYFERDTLLYPLSVKRDEVIATSGPSSIGSI